MLKSIAVSLLFVLCLTLLAGCTAQRTEVEPAPQKTAERAPGVDFAIGAATITGLAISPLLMASSFGLYQRYLDKNPDNNDQWFCSPLFWGFGFLLLFLCSAKDVAAPLIPAAAKKPLDLAELLENKLSAVVVMIGVVPILSYEFTRTLLQDDAVAAFIQSNFSLLLKLIVPTGLSSTNAMVGIVAVPVFMAAFLAVWLLSHTINVIIAISPFGLLDFGLKSFRFLLIVSLYAAYHVSHWFGTTYSLLIVLIAVILAGWAFRLMIYGTILATDLFFPFISRKDIDTRSPHAFLSTRIAGVPVRTFGKASSTSNGQICFCYKPWLYFKARTINLPKGRYALSRGLLYPSLLGKDVSEHTLLNFPPRYRGHEERIGLQMGVCEVQDGSLLSGLKRMRAWLRDFVSGFMPGNSFY